ncbi:unnamed protein product, partial [Didymodactylos carnosus]
SLIVHTIFYHGKDIIEYSRTSLKKRQNDIHCTLMAKYPEVSELWFIVLFLIAFILSVFVCHFGQFMPWYYLFVAVPLMFICSLPIGIVEARTTIEILPMFILAALGATFLKGNNVVALMTFMIYSYQMLTQSLLLIRNLKFGATNILGASSVTSGMLWLLLIAGLLPIVLW